MDTPSTYTEYEEKINENIQINEYQWSMRPSLFLLRETNCRREEEKYRDKHRASFFTH